MNIQQQQQTESIRNIVESIEKGNVVLPEFQRDFVWEIKKTCELFDSLVRDIFVGSIIYGKPSFEISVREIDNRPRTGIGSRKKLNVTSIDSEELKQKNQITNFRLILDGQQRVTSIYRALKGIDDIWFIIKNEEELDFEEERSLKELSLEDLMYSFSIHEDEDRVSIRLSDVYIISQGDLFDEEIKESFFDKLAVLAGMDKVEINNNFRKYRIVCQKLCDLLKSEVLLSYYLLNMNNEKFALFFERSNSKGIQLNFIDILAAKLYKGFNLREKNEELETKYPKYNFNREIIVRTVAYIVSQGKEVDRNYILTDLNYEHFNQYWEEVCELYSRVLDFLIKNNFIISQSWMPYENMVIPLIVFLRENKQKDFSQMNEKQLEFIKYWYWASIFSQRYSAGSNEAIIQDAGILRMIAQDSKVSDRVFFSRLKSQIVEYNDIFSYTKKVNVIYKGILNLINYKAGGLLDWNNSSKLSEEKKLEDHHIFPKEYIKQNFKNDEQALFLIDCVANRTLIPKITNIKVGKKKPSVYLKEINKSNNTLDTTLELHLIPAKIVTGTFDEFYLQFLDERAKKIFGIIQETILEKEKTIFENYYQAPEIKGNIKIFATYKKKSFEAVLDMESEKVLFMDESHSVSTAAEKAKSIVNPEIQTSTNGWRFWKYINSQGEVSYINELRKQLSN